MNRVKLYYNQYVEAEDKRLTNHCFELPLTLHFIEKYLAPGSKILDAACGTGHYAQELLKKGYQVALNDLAEKNIDRTRKRVKNHSNLLFISQSDVMNSRIWKSKSWDSILLLGPLYHLPDENDRISLLKKAKKALKDNGILFCAFMNRTLAMVYGLKNNPEGILSPKGAKKMWQTGSDTDFVEQSEYFNHAYFSFPKEINPLIKQAGLIPLHLAGAEGFFSERFELFHQLPDSLKKNWKDFIIKHCEDEHMIHHSKHLLSVSKK